MTDWPPSAVLPAIQLFLAAMYSRWSTFPICLAVLILKVCVCMFVCLPVCYTESVSTIITLPTQPPSIFRPVPTTSSHHRPRDVDAGQEGLLLQIIILMSLQMMTMMMITMMTTMTLMTLMMIMTIIKDPEMQVRNDTQITTTVFSQMMTEMMIMMTCFC